MNDIIECVTDLAAYVIGPDYLTLEQAPLIDTWHAMEEAVNAGLERYIGVLEFH